MQRRSFMRLSLAGIGAGIIAPQFVLAGPLAKKVSDNPMAGGVFYTKDSAGRWAKKAGAHSPILIKSKEGIQVITGHPMKPNKHWIVKHVLLDSDFKFIAENIFDPAKDKKAVSKFPMPSKKGPIYALSVCNLHDTWLSVLEV